MNKTVKHGELCDRGSSGLLLCYNCSRFTGYE
jgi:hypothetical protein